MRPLVAANLALRFALELTALGAIVVWGADVGGLGGWLLGLAGALLAAAVWGLVVSPKARVSWPRPARFAVELAVFAVASAALANAGHGTFAVAFLAVAVASGALNYAVTRH